VPQRILKKTRKVIKIEQNGRAQRAQTRARVPLVVYGDAITVDAQWNEQLAGSDASYPQAVRPAGRPMEGPDGSHSSPQSHDLSLNSEGGLIGD
jgi:hypothetical protein